MRAEATRKAAPVVERRNCVPRREPPDTLGKIVSNYFGGLGGLSWAELTEESRQRYRAVGAAVEAHVLGSREAPEALWARAQAAIWSYALRDIETLLSNMREGGPPPYQPPGEATEGKTP
jgi:hypothetical protein